MPNSVKSCGGRWEFGWRLVRIPLRRQPTIQACGRFPNESEKGPNMPTFCALDFVSELPILRSWDANWRKSFPIAIHARPEAGFLGRYQPDRSECAHGRKRPGLGWTPRPGSLCTPGHEAGSSKERGHNFPLFRSYSVPASSRLYSAIGSCPGSSRPANRRVLYPHHSVAHRSQA
jgi:hypothetical protein